MMARFLVKQRTNNSKSGVPAYVATIPVIERRVHENQLHVADICDAPIIEIVALDTYRTFETENPIAHSFVASANALIVWWAGKVLCIRDAFESYGVGFASETLLGMRVACSDTGKQQ